MRGSSVRGRQCGAGRTQTRKRHSAFYTVRAPKRRHSRAVRGPRCARRAVKPHPRVSHGALESTHAPAGGHRDRLEHQDHHRPGVVEVAPPPSDAVRLDVAARTGEWRRDGARGGKETVSRPHAAVSAPPAAGRPLSPPPILIITPPCLTEATRRRRRRYSDLLLQGGRRRFVFNKRK